mmetsp:Transcript_14810/g.31001  ORF Transcript_14810/g.31001 Transcript_14810/m.31001 type:complete len:170 (+) Transcript_14810:515-1024(+)
MKRSKKRSAGTKRRSNGLDKVEVESNNATERKEWYYIKCYDERNECDVTEIKNETTNEIIIPPIKIELKPMPIRYKKIDESFCMLLNDIRPMEVRDLIGNVCNRFSAQNEFSHDGSKYTDIRFSAEDDDCKITDEDKDKGGHVGTSAENNDDHGDGNDEGFNVSFTHDS